MDEEEPARLVEVASLEEHDDMVSALAASQSHDGLVLSGSYDRRYSRTSLRMLEQLADKRPKTRIAHNVATSGCTFCCTKHLFLTDHTSDLFCVA